MIDLLRCRNDLLQRSAVVGRGGMFAAVFVVFVVVFSLEHAQVIVVVACGWMGDRVG